MVLKPCRQLGDLADADNVSGGDFRDFLVDLRCCRLSNFAGSFSKSTIYMEAADIDLVAKLPELLFCR